MTKLELWALKFLLRRYGETELDQWDLLKIQLNKYGKLYIALSREPVTGTRSDYKEIL